GVFGRGGSQRGLDRAAIPSPRRAELEHERAARSVDLLARRLVPAELFVLHRGFHPSLQGESHAKLRRQSISKRAVKCRSAGACSTMRKPRAALAWRETYVRASST